MIRTSTDGAVRTVTLDRPERRNALTPAGLDQLAAAVTGADEPVVLLRGAGSAFCAGADLDVVDGLADRAAAEAFARHGQRAARAIERAAPVVVAGIDGAARGGGLELALACDVRVATPEATLAESGIEHGLFGAWGGTVRLPAVCGPGVAADLACSGRVVDAETALRLGLVSRVVDEPATVAAEIAANDRAAVRTIAERLRDATGRGGAASGRNSDGAAADRDDDGAAAGRDSDGAAESRRERLEAREAAAFADLVVERNAE